MANDITGCPCCSGLVVMVAVRCSHCGNIHRAGDATPRHDRPADPGSLGDRGLVVDVPAALTRSSPGPPAAALVRAPAMRASTVYGNRRPVRRPPPAALPRAAPRRPLVQVIEEVINRGPAASLAPGTRVAVRNRFNGRWGPGFVVHEVLDEGYRLRREHNHAVLPAVFLRADVASDAAADVTTSHARARLSRLSRRARTTTAASPSSDTIHPRRSTPVAR
jgi:hypothetical protein